jgi:acylphosphatase
MEKRIHIKVHGLIQGVGFRMFVFREASSLHLSGWTRNLSDGTVEIEAQGDAGILDHFLRKVRIGPSRSMVKSLAVRDIEQDNSETEFRIRY